MGIVKRRWSVRRSRLWLLLAVLVWLAVRWWQGGLLPPAFEPLAEGTYRVERVIDGDTLLLTDGRRVRLIGIDAPESVKPDHPVEPWGLQAAELMRRLIGPQPVRLEFDDERLDRYGRTLAYVWVDQRLLNEELLLAGLARFEPQYHYSNSMKTRFRRAENEARQAGRGLWSAAQ